MSDQDFMDMTYWKATRLNGTDFHTGTVDYAAALTSGVPATVAPDSGWDEGQTFPALVGCTWQPSPPSVWACRGRVGCSRWNRLTTGATTGLATRTRWGHQRAGSA